jgi:hypothetical protein
MDKAELIKVGRGVIRPAYSGDIVEWLEGNVNAIPDSPMPGPFRSDRTPWIAEALRIAADPETRLLTILASIQSGKSLLARLFSCYIIANQPGPTMVLQATDAEAKDFSIRYLRPVWNNCPPVKDKFKNDDMERSTTSDFDRMTIYCRGIHNETNLQRLSLRYVIADECWMAPQGHLAEASARVTAFGWMGKRIFMSQGGQDGQEFHQLHESTDMRDWNMSCPACGHLQPWTWAQVKFPEEAKVNDEWDFLKVAHGTTYECVSCKERLPDTNATRLEANSKGRFVSTKASTNASYVGLHWNSMATMSWGELAVMLIKAKESIEEYGDEEPLRIFIQKRLAEKFEEQADEIKTEAAPGDFAMGSDWEQEGGFVKGRPTVFHAITPEMRAEPDFVRMRFMGVDVQKRGFYWVIRGWSGDGRSRMVDCGYCFSWSQLIEAHTKYQVHPANVFVDSGYQPDEVLQACAANGWVATRGDQRNEFAWRVKTPAGLKTELRPYSAPVVEAVGGKRVKRFYFSNLRLKDVLAALIKRGKHMIPRDVSEEYKEQMKSEKRTISTNGKPLWEQIAQRDNHFWDCEVICILPALAWRLTGRVDDVIDIPEKESAPEQES